MPENPSGITREQVAHLGRLARLSLTDDELDHYRDQLADILAAVARVSEVATPEVPATSHPMPLQNVFRDDVERPSLDRDEILAVAPAAEDGRFRVPRILDEE
jgi:aspartyl-tRNA(Asn)/glutamyl-tRNA(Gln) amidotransferase subunit C